MSETQVDYYEDDYEGEWKRKIIIEKNFNNRDNLQTKIVNNRGRDDP